MSYVTRKGTVIGGGTSAQMSSYKKKIGGKKRRVSTTKTTYNSRVPLRTGGYRYNNIEKKFQDSVFTSSPINTTGSVTALFFPTLGSDFTNRIGRKTMIRSIYFRGFVTTQAAINTPGTTQAIAAQQLRLIIGLDMQPNGANPAVTDVLVTNFPTSMLNLNNRDRFKILTDKVYQFDPYVAVGGTPTSASFNHTIQKLKWYKRCRIESVFNSTNGGSVADLNSGSIFLLLIGSNASGTNNAGLLYGVVRVRFEDQ